MQAVIIERDYKGYYSRFAKSVEDFLAEYPQLDLSSESGSAQTLRPLVHMWYALTDTESELFKTFFSDMTFGLLESDIENGNLAVIDYEEMVGQLED